VTDASTLAIVVVLTIKGLWSPLLADLSPFLELIDRRRLAEENESVPVVSVRWICEPCDGERRLFLFFSFGHALDWAVQVGR